MGIIGAVGSTFQLDLRSHDIGIGEKSPHYSFTIVIIGQIHVGAVLHHIWMVDRMGIIGAVGSTIQLDIRSHDM